MLLFSGGLDSLLTTFIAKKEKIETYALYFHTVFSHISRKEAEDKFNAYLKKLGIPLKIIDFSSSHIDMVKNPSYGYGANLNPCLDCKIFMFNAAKKFMKRIGASFIISGEVLGERPMTQHRSLFNKIEKETGLEGLILRPLSARLLKPTLPEREGIVNREGLYGIQGRGRTQQFALAREFAINNFPTPSGGCLLTNPSFCLRLKDLLNYNPNFSLRDCRLLKIGRHFRLSSKAKLIVARNEKENVALVRFRKNVLQLCPQDVKGPFGLGIGEFNSSLVKKACFILGRYCKGDVFVIKVNDRKVLVDKKIAFSLVKRFLIGG